MKPPLKILCAFVSLGICGAFILFVYQTLIEGTSGGPDFVEALRSGAVTSDSITSVEVVDPKNGSLPFAAKEYANLSRLTTIDSTSAIRQFCETIVQAQDKRGFAPNHPVSIWSKYLRVNTSESFYWLYCNLEEDEHGRILSIHANTANATNPNGGHHHYLDSYPELLSALTQKPDTEQVGGGNALEPPARPSSAPKKARATP